MDSLLLIHPGRRLPELRQRMTHLAHRLAVALRAGLEERRKQTEGCMGKLHSLSPLAVLDRGYGIARLLPEGKIIRDAAQLSREDRVSVKVSHGEFEARVEGVKEEDGKKEDEKEKDGGASCKSRLCRHSRGSGNLELLEKAWIPGRALPCTLRGAGLRLPGMTISL